MREPIHPGETLREVLDALGMSAAELARRIEVLVNRITRVLNGRRAVTGDSAATPRPLLRHLGRILTQPPESSTSCGLRSTRTARRSPGCPLPTPMGGKARRSKPFSNQFEPAIACGGVEPLGTDEITLADIESYQRFDADWLSFEDSTTPTTD